MSTIETVAEVLRRLESLRELSVGGLAEHLGLPKSTVSRLLKEMSRTGFLTRNDRTRRYAPGPLLLSAARHYKAGGDLIDRAAAALEAVVGRFGHTGFVLGLERSNLVLLRTIASTRPVRVQITDADLGGLAFYRSGGRALLARLSDAEVAALYRGTAPPPSAHSPQDLPALLSALRNVRSQGYAESFGEVIPEVGGIAVAVGPADQDAVALNVAFPARLVDQDERRAIATALLEVARGWVAS